MEHLVPFFAENCEQTLGGRDCVWVGEQKLERMVKR